MKYKVYIEDEYLMFENKRGNRIAFPFNEILNFTIINVGSDALAPTMLNGKPFFLIKKDPTLKGTILFALDTYNEKEIQKKNYKKIIRKYNYLKMKNVDNVFDIGEQLIDLKINYDSVILKEIKKIDNDGHEFYSYTKKTG